MFMFLTILWNVVTMFSNFQEGFSLISPKLHRFCLYHFTHKILMFEKSCWGGGSGRWGSGLGYHHHYWLLSVFEDDGLRPVEVGQVLRWLYRPIIEWQSLLQFEQMKMVSHDELDVSQFLFRCFLSLRFLLSSSAFSNTCN